jgi:N-hydroxyarylamine O-acetyltransferase
MTGSTKPATSAQVAAYLDRVGFTTAPRADLGTLRALHRAHVEIIAWENLDMALDRPISRDPGAAFDKIVSRARGGWCYEMNGLFAWMLEAIGFRVTRLAGAVMRDVAGDAMIGNHLVLLIALDRQYVADVGLGSGLIEPVPLAEGAIEQGFRRFALQRLGSEWWRFHNHPGAMPCSFDFSPAVTDEALLEDRSRWLQVDPASPFAGSSVVQRYWPECHRSLVNDTVSEANAHGIKSWPVNDADQYQDLLQDSFGLELPEARLLWAQRHRTTTQACVPPDEPLLAPVY